MTVVTVDNLHTCEDPRARLHQAASIARVQAGSELSRVIVRVPDRDTQGLRVFQLQDVARLLQREGRIEELAVTDSGTIVAAADVIQRRGQLAIWTGPAIGPWMPSDIVQRGLGGSETAAFRLAEQFAAMNWCVSLYGHFEADGLTEDVILRHFGSFDPTEHLDALIVFRDATILDERPNADFVALWLEDLAPAEGLNPRRAANCDRICAVSRWHAAQVLREHPWLEQSHVVACRNGLHLPWFRDED